MQAYFTFNGNCREAMTFYKKCLGGKLTLQTVTRVKENETIHPLVKNVVAHACLKTKFFVLQGTDLMEEQPLQKGNNVSLILECGSKAEMKKYFTKLSQNGKRNLEPMVTDHGVLLAGLTDQFGMQWLLNFRESN